MNQQRNGQMRKLLLPILLIIIPLLGGCAEEQPQGPLSETRLLLDTYCTITIYEPYDPALLEEAFELCAKYEATLSRTVEGSDVWRVNHAGGLPVTVDPKTAALIRTGLDYGGMSDGMFDITIGRLSSLWDFGKSSTVPPEPDLIAARETVDHGRVTVTGATVLLADPKAWLDLGGIAKGYMADEIAGFLMERGVEGAVIDLGGDISVIGAKPDGDPWRVGIRDPFSESREVFGVLSTGEASVVTSGIFERRFVEDGVLYHHILDPVTGMPAEIDIVGVTLVTESATAGDAFATALIVGGSEKAEALLEKVPGLIGAILALESGELIRYGDIDLQLIG